MFLGRFSAHLSPKCDHIILRNQLSRSLYRPLMRECSKRYHVLTNLSVGDALCLIRSHKNKERISWRMTSAAPLRAEAHRLLDGRHSNRQLTMKRDFAFSGLVTCGHCGCSLVGEIKKGRYIYYHRTGYKGKCMEPYTREEVFEEKFSVLLKGLVLASKIMGCVTEALRQSHSDAKQHHDAAKNRLQAEYNRLQSRIDAMYLDKLKSPSN
jgi:hypothetical protein